MPRAKKAAPPLRTVVLGPRNSARDAFFLAATGLHAMDMLAHIRRLPYGENRRLLWRYYRRLHAALRAGNRDATEAWAIVLAIGIKSAVRLIPLAVNGQKFNGRKPGAIGRIRRAIRAALKQIPPKNRSMPPRALWARMKADSALCRRFNIEFYEKSAYAGRDVTYDRFVDILREERLPSKKVAV